MRLLQPFNYQEGESKLCLLKSRATIYIRPNISTTLGFPKLQPWLNISVLGSSANCNQGSQNANALTNKYCGAVLNPMAGATVSVPICGNIFFL